MEVWLVLDTYSHHEGEPIDIFSTKEKAEKYIKEVKHNYSTPLRIWRFIVDDEV